MPTRLVLVCASGTAAARSGRFPDLSEPLDAGGRAKARALVLDGPAARECWTSPVRAAAETAALLGVLAEPEPALADIDHGDWAGRSLEAIDRDALTGWLAAPEAGTPGGESMTQVLERAAPWLDRLCGGERRVLATTHPAVIRALLAHALGIPIAATYAIDVAPLSRTVLSFHDRWRLQELRRA